MIAEVPASGRRRKKPQPVERIALGRKEAADALGVSLDFFEDHVLPELAVVRVGRLVLIPPAELERWVQKNAARALA